MNIQIEGPTAGADFPALCEPILRALPGWFGIEEALLMYARQTAELPTLIAWDGNTAAGFLTFKQYTPYAAEITAMGVLPSHHRRGIGQALVERAEAALRAAGVEYLQVKTLAATVLDEGYALTRAFYQEMGFRPLEILPQLWNEENPCLVFVKKLG